MLSLSRAWSRIWLGHGQSRETHSFVSEGLVTVGTVSLDTKVIFLVLQVLNHPL